MPQQKQQQDRVEADSRPGSAARKLPAPPPDLGPALGLPGAPTWGGGAGTGRRGLWWPSLSGIYAPQGTRHSGPSLLHLPTLALSPSDALSGWARGGSGHSSSSSTSRPGRCPAAGGPGTASRYCPGGSGCPARGRAGGERAQGCGSTVPKALAWRHVLRFSGQGSHCPPTSGPALAYAPRSVQQQKRPWLSCPRARRHHRGPARWARHCRPVSGHAHSQRPRRECLPHGPAVPHGHVKNRVTGAPSAVASTPQALDMFGKEGKKGSKGKWAGRWTPRKGSRRRPHACRGPSPCQGSGAFRPQPCFPPLPFGSASEGFLWRPSQTFCPPSSQILVTFGDRKMG